MEEIAISVTKYISHAVEVISAVIIGIALIQVVWQYLITLSKPTKKISQESIRLQFGSSVAVALELLLGADVLSTAVAPSWDDIGKLASIAVLRTALNYFLEKELSQSKHHSI